ncbi:MAG: translation initiation factor IF-2 [Patescibacteria group bacterium]
MKRPPIVVVMGHVDHGKTTLLDFIKKSKVAEREAGGITQSIGAYEVEVKGSSKITFIDTPGHEAFSKMRSRGSNIADIAILMVAADDGVKNQTKESINILKESQTPFVVAINKIDKNNADVNRVKSELAQAGVSLEGFGGNISYKEISAKTGEGIDGLLELILLVAEMEELSYSPQSPARGFVLESKLDSRRGVVASLIIRDGVLKVGNKINVGAIGAKIKSLENFLGKKIKQAEPSAPVLVLGFSEVPEVGVEFVSSTVISTEAQRSGEISSMRSLGKLEMTTGDKTPVNVILKASDSGSLEALAEVIANIPVSENIFINLIEQAVGDVTDSNVKLATNTGAIIIGFKVKVSQVAKNAAGKKVKIIASDIIYKLIEQFEEVLNKLKEALIIGDLEILAVFGKKSGNQIIGGKVVEGEILNQARCEIKRGDNVVGKCKIVNLQKGKEDATKVEDGNECGLLVSTDIEVKVGDHIVIHEDI